MTAEGVALTYYEKVKEAENPVKDLTSFYCEIFSIPFSIELVKAISRAVTLYGREIVFYSILSLEGSENLSHDNIFPLLRYICNKKMGEKGPAINSDLTSYATSMEKLVEKAKHTNWKIRSPFDD